MLPLLLLGLVACSGKEMSLDSGLTDDNDRESSGGGTSIAVDTGDAEADPEPEVRDSCTIVTGICVETDETDNDIWCDGVGGTYVAASGCDSDGAVVCDLPAGGDYSNAAVAYYTGDFGADTCTDAGGTVR